VPAGLAEIWITESSAGGGGVIEEVLRHFAADPRRFFRLAESALEMTDFELTDRELTRVLEMTGADETVAEAFDAVRAADSHESRRVAEEALRRVLTERGVVLTHAVASALQARVLRAGSSVRTDQLLRELVLDWQSEEARLGIEIDARVFAYLAGSRQEHAAVLASVGLVPHQDPFWRFQAIYGLLWPRGYLVRASTLASYNPFVELPPTDRELLLDLLGRGETRVELTDGWPTRLQAVLEREGSARLDTNVGRHPDLKAALLRLAVEPLEVRSLHLFPFVEAVRQEADIISVTLDLREVQS
jgi:hypothetical protein